MSLNKQTKTKYVYLSKFLFNIRYFCCRKNSTGQKAETSSPSTSSIHQGEAQFRPGQPPLPPALSHQSGDWRGCPDSPSQLCCSVNLWESTLGGGKTLQLLFLTSTWPYLETQFCLFSTALLLLPVYPFQQFSIFIIPKQNKLTIKKQCVLLV